MSILNKRFFIIYFIFLLVFSVFTYVFVDPNLIYLRNIYSGFAFWHRMETTIIYVLLVIINFVFYLFFLHKIKKKVLKGSTVIKLIAITTIVLLFSYPAVLSYDIFNYLATAKVLFLYKENPYAVMPIEFTGDPLLLFTHAVNKLALYGPSWIILSGLPHFLGFGNFIVTLWSFKVFIAVFYLATLFTLWKMTKDLYSLALFSLNPLVVVESLVSAHNDIVMVFFTLIAFYMLKKRVVLLSIVFLVISVCIKYATVILFPVFIISYYYVLKKKFISWEKIYILSALLMFFVFVLSFLREEIYPWYSLWFLSFIPFVHKKNRLMLYLVFALTFGLLMRYIPFMLTGSHHGLTPVLKIFFSFAPPAIVLLLNLRLVAKIVRSI